MTETPDEEPGTDLVHVPFEQSPLDRIEEMKVGKVSHILKKVGQCNTCWSPYHLQIEMWALQGERIPWMHAELLAQVNGREDLIPSVQSLRRHLLNNHSSAAAMANQRIIDETAARLGQKIDETVQQRITVLALAEKIVSDRAKDVFAGEGEKQSDAMVMKAMDILQAQDRNTKSGSLDTDAFMAVINRMLAYANDHVADRTAFTEALLADPVLARFDRIMRGLPADPDEIEQTA